MRNLHLEVHQSEKVALLLLIGLVIPVKLIPPLNTPPEATHMGIPFQLLNVKILKLGFQLVQKNHCQVVTFVNLLAPSGIGRFVRVVHSFNVRYTPESGH